MEDGTRHVADRDELDRGCRRLPPEQRAILVFEHIALFAVLDRVLATLVIR